MAVLGCGYTANVPTASGANSLQVSPSTIDFGTVAVGQTANTTVSLSNRGADAVEVSEFSVAGQTFSIAQSHFPVKIAPGAAYSVSVGFKPSSNNSFSGKFTALDSASRTIAQSPLSGSGVTAADSGTPTLFVSSTNLNFGNVTVGSNSQLIVTAASIGSSPVTISSASISGSGYSVSGASFPLTLYQYQAVTLVFTFAPPSANTLTGTFVLNSNSSTGSSTSISMTGTGVPSATNPLLTASSNYLVFGNVAVGSSATLPVTLTSTGTSAVTINSASIGGSGYSFSGASFPLTLNPQQSVTLQFKFAPPSANTLTGTLVLNTNAATGSTMYINSTGTGVAGAPTSNAQLTVSPTSLSFGDVSLGSNAMLGITLTSSGTTAVTISSVKISGSGFTMSGAAFPVTLSPQQSVALQVQFAPTAANSATGTLTISSNSSTNGTVRVSLSGTGASGQHQVNLSWQAPSSSSDPVAGYHIYRTTGSSSSYSLMNSSVDTQTSYVDSAVASGTAYTYYVKSVDSAGNESVPSNSISVTIP